MTYPVSMNPYIYNPALISSLYPTSVAAPSPISSNPTGVLATSNAAAYKFTKAQAASLVGLTGYATQLNSSAAALDASSAYSVWNQRSVTSTAAASVSGVASNGAKIASYTVSVSQIAVAQQSVGTSLNSAATTTLAAGTQSFSITSAGVVKNISFSVTAGDTNKTVLGKMADSINVANTGITASVMTNALTGTSQLSLVAKNTGIVNAFSLADISGTAVATSGANTILKASANGAYSVNGVSYTSSKNTVVLTDPKVSLNLIAPVTGATVTVGNNTDSIAAAITNFTNSYNSTLSYLSQNQQYLSPQITATLKNAFTNNSYILEKAGITANPDGTLKVDLAALSKSIKTNPVALMQPLSGYAGLSQISKNLAQKITSSVLSTFAKPQSYVMPARIPAYSGKYNTYLQLIGTLFTKVV